MASYRSWWQDERIASLLGRRSIGLPRSNDRSLWIRYYIELGWPLIPIHHVEDDACTCRLQMSCKSPGKHPRNTNGCKGGSTNLSALLNYAKRWPNMNLGVVTGAEIGLLVVDVDPRHSGERSLRRLEADYEELPETYLVRTGGGGLHLYFTALVATASVRNSAGLLGEGIDVRANGGYVVAPPSVHASGGRYAVLCPDEVAIAPSWIIDMITQHSHSSPTARSSNCIAHDIRRLRSISPPLDLDDAVRRVLTAPEGRRNDTLNAVAFWTGRRVSRGSLSEIEAVSRLSAAAALAGLDAVEIERTLNSGFSAGLEADQ